MCTRHSRMRPAILQEQLAPQFCMCHGLIGIQKGSARTILTMRADPQRREHHPRAGEKWREVAQRLNHGLGVQLPAFQKSLTTRPKSWLREGIDLVCKQGHRAFRSRSSDTQGETQWPSGMLHTERGVGAEGLRCSSRTFIGQHKPSGVTRLAYVGQ